MKRLANRLFGKALRKRDRAQHLHQSAAMSDYDAAVLKSYLSRVEKQYSWNT
jgi:hypothetical protein